MPCLYDIIYTNCKLLKMFRSSAHLHSLYIQYVHLEVNEVKYVTVN